MDKKTVIITNEMVKKYVSIDDVIEGAELPDIVAGKKPGRENPNDRLMCELVGMGSPDLCIATMAYNRITESGDELTEVDMMG